MSHPAPANADSLTPTPEPGRFLGLNILFDRHDYHFVAELLRRTSGATFLAVPSEGVLPAPGRSCPPSYLAMRDLGNEAGKIVMQYGEAAWAELVDACQEGKIHFPNDPSDLPAESQARLRILLADLWFWKLHTRCIPMPDPTTIPNAQAALEEVAELRKGNASFHRHVAAGGWPKVEVFGGIAVIYGQRLEVTPQSAEILALALRPGGLSFEDAKEHFGWPHEPDNGITARVARLTNALYSQTQRLAFTIEVTTESKCISAIVRMKPVATE